MSDNLKRLPKEEIEWIRGLRQQGETWESIAQKWDLGTTTLYNRLRASGVDPTRMGIPVGLPVVAMSEVAKAPSLVAGPNVITIRKGSDLVIMPVAEYLRITGARCG